MTAAVRYHRTQTVVWRDTGEHILALQLGRDREVLVLGGGAAQLWRLLERPRRWGDLCAVLTGPADGASPEVAAAALEELVSLGLARRMDS